MTRTIALLLLSSACLLAEKKPPRVLTDYERQNAYQLSLNQIVSELKAPSTAHWSDLEHSVIKPAMFNQISVEITTDAQNSFGAMLRNTWSCTVNGPNKKGLYHVLCFERP